MINMNVRSFRTMLIGTGVIVIMLFTSASSFAASDDDMAEYDEKTLEMYHQLYLEDQEAIKEINKNLPEMLEEGERLARTDAKANEVQTRASSSLGTNGDIIVNLVVDSGSVGFAGHAAIVSSNSSKTIESYAKKWSPIKKDGVQYYSNTWNKKSGTLLVRPKGASSTQYTKASSYAAKQVGKPYNWNFKDKNNTKKFYCSQLVWKAWKVAGIDCEKGSIPNAIIAPADLVNSTNTYVVKKVS